MLQIGDKLGSLTVVSDRETAMNDILNMVRPDAEKEWTKFDKWYVTKWLISKYDSFETYFKLNEREQVLFSEKKMMPESFVLKYFNVLMGGGFIARKESQYSFIRRHNFLHSDKRADSYLDCIYGLQTGDMYKVLNDIDGKYYYIDETSFRLKLF